MYPKLFEIPVPWGTLPIYAYGVMLGFSLLVGWQLVMALGRRDALDRGLLGDVFLSSAIAGIVGARLLYVLTNLDELSPSQWFDIRNGGLVAYGGFLAGFAAAYVHLRRQKKLLLAFADVAAPALALGLFFTRIGCYLAGCDFGARLSSSAPAWLAHLGSFPQWDAVAVGLRGSPAFLHHVSVYGLPYDAAYSFPVHPTQLYEAALGVVLALLCLRIGRARRFPGQVVLVLALGYGVGRYLLEYLRDDPERGAALGFSTSQLISMLLVPFAATAYSVLSRRARG